MLLNTNSSGLCNCSFCNILCQGVPCLAVFIRRLHIKALMLSICFEHIAGINQLKVSLSAPRKIRRILIWHRSINSHVVHFQGCKATQEGGKTADATVLPPACNSPVAVGQWIYTSHLSAKRCFYSLSAEICDI